jgi:hypothetical protein
MKRVISMRHLHRIIIIVFIILNLLFLVLNIFKFSNNYNELLKIKEVHSRANTLLSNIERGM